MCQNHRAGSGGRDDHLVPPKGLVSGVQGVVEGDVGMKSEEIAIKRETLLASLRNQTGDPEEDHGEAERLLIHWLASFDDELARAWDTASQDWWYA